MTDVGVPASPVVQRQPEAHAPTEAEARTATGTNERGAAVSAPNAPRRARPKAKQTARGNERAERPKQTGTKPNRKRNARKANRNETSAGKPVRKAEKHSAATPAKHSSAAAATDWRLFVERTRGDSRTCDATALTAIEVPRGQAALDSDALRGDLSSAFASSPQRPETPGLDFEAVRSGNRNVLILAARPGSGARVNGQRAPRLSVLDLADEVQLDSGVLHVSRFDRFEVGPPPPELIGERCEVCLLEIQRDATVYVHPACGRPLHVEPESTPEERRLRCGLLGSCPTCETPIPLESGFAHVPDLS